MTNNLEKIVNGMNSKVGKSGGFPSSMMYKVINNKLLVRFIGEQKLIREFDCWGFAYLDDLNSQLNENMRIHEIEFEMKDENIAKPYIESLKRRLSFLNINNEKVTIFFRINNIIENLYSIENMFNIGKEEIIREDIKPRCDENKPGRLEKDFQSYLFGNGLQHDNKRTNERLALLGADFKDKKGNQLLREFPTGSFKNEIKKTSRVMPTEFIDLVTVNKYKELSLVELKVSDENLKVISQALDYSLFFLIHKERLDNILLSHKFDYSSIKSFKTYIVNNYFHPRFDNIFKYYQPVNTDYFQLKKTTLGYYQTESE